MRKINIAIKYLWIVFALFVTYYFVRFLFSGSVQPYYTPPNFLVHLADVIRETIDVLVVNLLLVPLFWYRLIPGTYYTMLSIISVLFWVWLIAIIVLYRKRSKLQLKPKVIFNDNKLLAQNIVLTVSIILLWIGFILFFLIYHWHSNFFDGGQHLADVGFWNHLSSSIRHTVYMIVSNVILAPFLHWQQSYGSLGFYNLNRQAVDRFISALVWVWIIILIKLYRTRANVRKQAREPMPK